MIVHHREENDPKFDGSKITILEEMLGDLKYHGAQRGIGVQPRSSVLAIASHVQQAERVTLIQ